MKGKAVISNRIYLTKREDVFKEILHKLTYTIPPKTMWDPPIVISDVVLISNNVFSIPVSRIDLIPEDYEIIDKRVLVPTNFPEPKIGLREDQSEIIDQIEDNGIIVAKPGWGKAQPEYSKVRIPNGWTTMGDIKIGDEVVTPNNTISKVVNKYYNKNRDIYKITLYDGREVDASDEHLWAVYLGRSKTLSLITTLELKAAVENSTRVYLPLTSPITDIKSQYFLHPYVLGILLGDGGMTTSSVMLSTADEFILNKVRELLPEGHSINFASNYDYRIIGQNRVNKVSEEIQKLGLRGLKSHEKFIPQIYKFGTMEDKLHLLAGLFDADGSVETDTASFEFTTTSKRLMDDVCELIYSLGGVANVQTRITQYTYKNEKKQGRVSYRVRPSRLPLYIKEKLFSLPRKLQHIKKGQYDNTGKIRVETVKFLNKQDCYCIELDSEDKLYITDNYIVTHNTFSSLHLAKKLGQKTLVVVHTVALRDQWEVETKKLFGINAGIIGSGKFNIDSPVVIANTQTLTKCIDKYSKEFGTLIADETHRMPANTFKNIVDSSYARYKFGLSATPKREDGRHIVLSDYFGSDRWVPSTDTALPLKVVVIDIGDLNLDVQGKSYAERVNNLTCNHTYIRLISDLSKAYIDKGHKILCVGDRLQFLNNLVELNPSLALVTSETSSPDRTEIHRSFYSDKPPYDGIAGTLSIYKEGVSVNPLSTLILGAQISSEIVLEQVAGRVTRPHPGKQNPILLDIAVTNIKSFNGMYRKRMNYYASRGYNVEVIKA